MTNPAWTQRAALAALALACVSPLEAREPEGRTFAALADTEFCAFLARFEQATNRFIDGDKSQWLALASRRADATIMGAWGDYEAGWSKVGPRYEWAAARFVPSGAKLSVEYLSLGSSGDVAYTVAIERSEALVVGQKRPRPMQLRVTHVFRKEDGAWRLVHRHADPLMNKTAPADALAR